MLGIRISLFCLILFLAVGCKGADAIPAATGSVAPTPEMYVVNAEEGDLITIPAGIWNIVDTNGEPVKALWIEGDVHWLNLCTFGHEDNHCALFLDKDLEVYYNTNPDTPQ